MPRIPVIIPTKGRPDKITNCLCALASQSLTLCDYEILVGIDDDNAAIAAHDHPMDPDDYLLREMRLGYSAWGFAHAAPECAHEMYHCDTASDTKLDEYRAKTDEFRASYDSMLHWFRAWGDEPAAALSGDGGAHKRDELYRTHLPLKRHCWRLGFLAASSGEKLSNFASLIADGAQIHGTVAVS